MDLTLLCINRALALFFFVCIMLGPIPGYGGPFTFVRIVLSLFVFLSSLIFISALCIILSRFVEIITHQFYILFKHRIVTLVLGALVLLGIAFFPAIAPAASDRQRCWRYVPAAGCW